MIINAKKEMEQQLTQHSSLILDYGVLGFLVILLLVVIRILWQATQKQHDENRRRITQLESYMEQDQKKLIQAIEESTKVIERNTTILERVLEK